MDISISTIVTTSIVGSFLLLLFCLAMGKGKVISKVGQMCIRDRSNLYDR